MFHIINSYLKFLRKSKNQHGVHSPFAFDLVTKCFYDKKPKAEYLILNKYRQRLLENKQTIEVTDFGAGSRVFKNNKRAVSKIANTAGISVKRAELLFRVVNYFKPQNTLEIGTSLGLATSALCLGNKKGAVISLEGCGETMKIAREQLNEFGLTNIEMVISEFEKYLQNPKHQSENLDLIYFDGNHQREATLNYFDLLLPTATNDTVWIFDDIHWSSEMETAWETIKKNPKVTLTIDTFQWGFIFFRREQEKEHFTIRV